MKNPVWMPNGQEAGKVGCYKAFRHFEPPSFTALSSGARHSDSQFSMGATGFKHYLFFA
jgi:hypothetical protein